MEQLNEHSFLYLVLRLILGTLFFFQGADKIFNLKISGVVEFFRSESAHKPIPDFVMVGSAWLTSFAEFFAGIMLLLGLFTQLALCLIGLDLVLVCAAFSLLRPMWDMQLVFPRLLLMAALLYLPESWNIFSVDSLLR